jgi:hypothetical protein
LIYGNAIFCSCERRRSGKYPFGHVPNLRVSADKTVPDKLLDRL